MLNSPFKDPPIFFMNQENSFTEILWPKIHSISVNVLICSCIGLILPGDQEALGLLSATILS
jgi:hypothetical protein